MKRNGSRSEGEGRDVWGRMRGVEGTETDTEMHCMRETKEGGRGGGGEIKYSDAGIETVWLFSHIRT